MPHRNNSETPAVNPELDAALASINSRLNYFRCLAEHTARSLLLATGVFLICITLALIAWGGCFLLADPLHIPSFKELLSITSVLAVLSVWTGGCYFFVTISSEWEIYKDTLIRKVAGKYAKWTQLYPPSR